MRRKAKGKGKEGRRRRERERERKLRNGQKKRAKETMRDWKKEAKEKTGQEWRRWVAGREGGGGTKSDEGNNGGKFYGIASSGGNCRVCTAEKDVEILKRGRGDGLVEGGRGRRLWRLMPSREKMLRCWSSNRISLTARALYSM